MGVLMASRSGRRNVIADLDVDPGVLGGRLREGDVTYVYRVRRLPVAMSSSLVAGALSGLLGLGGGIIKVPVLNTFCGIPIRVAAATSTFMIGVTAAASAFLYFSRGDVVLDDHRRRLPGRPAREPPGRAPQRPRAGALAEDPHGGGADRGRRAHGVRGPVSDQSQLDVVIEAVLTGGLAISSALLLFGLLLSRPGLLTAGIVMLLLTPVARVVVVTIDLLAAARLGVRRHLRLDPGRAALQPLRRLGPRAAREP